MKVLDTWRTLGMRDRVARRRDPNVFLPDAVMQGVRRPAGKWHPFMHTVACGAADFRRRLLGVAERRGTSRSASPAAQGRSAPAVTRRRAREPVATAQIAHDAWCR